MAYSYSSQYMPWLLLVQQEKKPVAYAAGFYHLSKI